MLAFRLSKSEQYKKGININFPANDNQFKTKREKLVIVFVFVYLVGHISLVSGHYRGTLCGHACKAK